ncbi:radical SAM family heme chaperone HemW [Bacteroides propionicifaciens]|uniref:radical SAM family heme chaperone HemW n=1 Tax=Bacteroides propionicifaciens TaxID=392838 RepID=UPI00035C8AB4|nr:radical SAM family heme chaperone HemW [Bacteroides propionicifaciens]
MAGIYIHIPFCKTRCSYCDFYSTTESSLSTPYIDAVCQELILRKDYLDSEPIRTIYLGGGTPSQLTYNELKQLFDTIAQHYDIAGATEITMEANPDDLSLDYLEALKSLPINRLSIGIQTFQPSMLKKLNRRHTSEQAIRAVLDAKRCGFDNISIDLMYGLPDETMENWRRDIQQAIDLDIQHISAYHLIYEKGTVMHKKLTQGFIQEVDEDFSLQSFTNLINILTENGFIHYEISNFAKPGKIAQHNTSYWTGDKYLGCGPSAHSYNGLNRCYNESSLRKYINSINKNKYSNEVEYLDISTQYNDYIITSLRTMRGLSLDMLQKRYGMTYYDYALNMAKKHLKDGNLELVDNNLKLTKSGIFISDGIMSDLLYIE